MFWASQYARSNQLRPPNIQRLPTYVQWRDNFIVIMAMFNTNYIIKYKLNGRHRDTKRFVNNLTFPYQRLYLARSYNVINPAKIRVRRHTIVH